MKRIIYIVGLLTLLSIGIGFSNSLTEVVEINSDNSQNDTIPFIEDRFENWTEEQYQQYEDSIWAVLYPPVTAHKAENSTSVAASNTIAQAYSLTIANSHVPNTIELDKRKVVGEIPINSSVSPTGAKTYEIPIEVYPGMRDFSPTLSFVYNSQQGNSIMGVGWSMAGLSMISRGNQTVYYDGKANGISFTNNDAFILDGVRLIKTGAEEDCLVFESEQGNIKAKGYISGNTMKYFEVFYPNGNKGIFGYTTTNSNKIYYPLTTLTDLKDNKIEYIYSYTDNHYNISKITYNGASVEFVYQPLRKDPILYYVGGLEVRESLLLMSVTCKLGSVVLGKYQLSYISGNNRALLSRVDYGVTGKGYNPLQFFYGSDNTANSYTSSTTQLNEWYESEDPKMIKVVKGKFDYDSGSDGLIALPNKNPYWKHHRNSSIFKHSQDRFDNSYTGDEKIFLYAGLKDDWAYPMPNLVTEKGFVDIMCGDLAGKQEEYIIKINNSVVDDKDQVTFQIYRSNLYSGLSKLYTRTYNFPTVHRDADNGKSIQPKYYYTGDFNGDGKMEVLAVSADKPFGDTDKPSKCYIFDLVNNKILYEGHVFSYAVEFIGTQQSDPKVAANNTDRLFVMDYDGDGKSDICHIDDNGINLYTFDVSGSTLVPRMVKQSTSFRKSNLKDREVLVGEVNGDGLMDLIISPKANSYNWSIYYSKGDGSFTGVDFNGPASNSDLDNAGYLLQDINRDGTSDLIAYDENGFTSQMNANNVIEASGAYCAYTSKSILIPTDINSRNSFTQLIALKDGIATKYSFARNDNLETMATGMANSLGIIEKNEYRLIDEKGVATGLYTKGSGAVYPYVNVQEPLAVISLTETYMNGALIDNNSFTYKNAVIHRQGLGFCGFEQITAFNKRGQTLVQTYEPYRFRLLKSEVSPQINNKYTYTVTVGEDKIAKIRLSNKVERDVIRGLTASTAYIYDSYGYPTQETTSYNGNITVKKTNVYSSRADVRDGYNLGFLSDQTVTVQRGGKSYKERMYIPAQSSRLPTVVIYYKDGNRVRQDIYTYDKYGNVTSDKVQLYSSTTSQNILCEYDSHGRIIKETDPLGLSNTYTYTSSGEVNTITDHRGGITKYEYDELGREISITLPDQSIGLTSYEWDTSGTNGLYAVKKNNTGQPTVKVVYDALKREVRSCETLCYGAIKTVDKIYDSYGNLQKESLPFTGSTAALWNTYSYDSNNRILSCTEASGRITTYKYNATSVTTIADNISTTRKYDAQGNLVAVTDPTGTIEYNLEADGQYASVVAPGGITTSFEYDKYRRQIGMSDPSQGTITYEYDAAGNLTVETNANGDATKREYDESNRLIKSSVSEFSTTYTYNDNNDLTRISSDNGTLKTISYDAYGRLSRILEKGVDGKWIQKGYTYADGNVSSIQYRTQGGLLGTETFSYQNGYLKEIDFNGTVIYRLTKENAFGSPTELSTGPITRRYSFSNYSMPTARRASVGVKDIQYFTYKFDAATLNLISRGDNTRKILEKFGYDNMNRLVSHGEHAVAYDIKGNITEKSDIGLFEYNNAQKPYAVSEAELTGNGIRVSSQDIEYTSFNRPSKITENRDIATFTYNSEYDRVNMRVTHDGVLSLNRYYLGKCYEYDQFSSGSREKLYIGGDNYYDALAVYIKEDSKTGLYYIVRDYLGSITHIISSDGTLVQELSYDAWGQLRNPENLEVYEPDETPELFLGRGYTGHEHLVEFGFVNMNARLYDPALGRFLSPDPYVQMPDLSQNFNRYTYALNNPLCYVDEDGESFLLVVGIVAGISAIANILGHLPEIKAAGGGWKTVGAIIGYGLAGGIAGGVGVAAGMWVAGGFTLSAAYTIGFGSGAVIGAAGGATSGFTLEFSNSLLEGQGYGSALQAGLNGAAIGGVVGGVSGGTVAGVNASIKGYNFWTGKTTVKGLLQRTATYAENKIGGTGRVAGSKKHAECKRKIEEFKQMFDGYDDILCEHTYNQNGKNFRPDVVDNINGVVYDYKYGYQNYTTEQLYDKFSKQLQNYQDVTNLNKSVIIRPKKSESTYLDKIIIKLLKK